MKQAIHKTTVSFYFPYSPSSPNSLMAAMGKSADIQAFIKTSGAVVTKTDQGLSTILAEATPKIVLPKSGEGA